MKIPKMLGKHKLVKRVGDKYFFYQRPEVGFIPGNAVEIFETNIAYEGEKIWTVKTLAKCIQMSSKAPESFLIINQCFYSNKQAAFKNWENPGFSKEEVPTEILNKILKIFVYKVRVLAKEYSGGKVVGSDTYEINVYAKNSAQARKRAVKCVSHGYETTAILGRIPYKQAEAEGQIY